MTLTQGTPVDLPARVEQLVGAFTLEEKIAQLYGVWVGAGHDGGEVAPHQNEFVDDEVDLDALLPSGLGQLTRPFGTAPVDAALGALSLMRTQQRIVAEGAHGVPAIAHEECLAGFASWGATAYPVPVSWGATFDPDLIERMAATIGRDMRSVGVHQGLAPVLDVVRDARWGRVEETIGEDPYLVGSIGAAYVRGLEGSGIIATLKHFVGYSASKGGRNLAPVSIGPRELADVLLAPFEMVLRDARPRSVMNAYTDIDGVPTAADASLLTGLLRDTWGFEGTVVSDYFTVAFLKMLHGTAGSWGDAAAAALAAGIDVELPTVHTFGAPLLEAVRDGRLTEEVIDRALRRVLVQKAALGMLAEGWSAVPSALEGRDLDDPEGLRGSIDLDPPENRALAREIAEQSVVLLRNDGILPIAGNGPARRSGSRSSGPTPTIRSPCSAATRSRRISASSTRTSRSASSCRRCSTPYASNSPRPRSTTCSAPPWTAVSPVGSRRRSSSRRRRTWWWRHSVIAPGSSAAAPAARDAMPSRSTCPAPSRSCSMRSSPPAPPSSSSCSPAGRTPWVRRRPEPGPSCRPSSPARRARPPSPAFSADG